MPLYGDTTWKNWVESEISCCRFAGTTALFLTIDDFATRNNPAWGERLNTTFPTWAPKSRPVYETHAHFFASV